MVVSSCNKANAGSRYMKRAMTQPGLQESPGPRQRRQHVGGLSISLPGTGVDVQATILHQKRWLTFILSRNGFNSVMIWEVCHSYFLLHKK